MIEIRTRSAHDGYTRGDEFVLHILVDVVQKCPNIPEARNVNRKPKRVTERTPALDRVLAFEHIIQGTVSFPITSTSTDIRVYDSAAKLVQ